jgi:hypothetical protein
MGRLDTKVWSSLKIQFTSHYETNRVYMTLIHGLALLDDICVDIHPAILTRSINRTSPRAAPIVLHQWLWRPESTLADVDRPLNDGIELHINERV